MKKLFVITLCSLLYCSAANAQLSNILGKVKEKVTNTATSAASSNDGGILSTIAGVISSKLVPSESQIIGTWTYQEPAIMVTSSNALKSTAASLATKKIEQRLQSYLNVAGIKKGKFSFTFNEDKTFSVNYGTKQVRKGTYTIDSKDVTLTFNGKTTPCKVTPQLDNGTLVIVMDATKLKTFFEGVGANISSLSTLVALMKQMDGMKIGVRLAKQ